MWDLLDLLQSLGIRLEQVDDRLYLDSPPRVMTDETRASIRLHRKEIVNSLKELKDKAKSDPIFALF